MAFNALFHLQYILGTEGDTRSIFGRFDVFLYDYMYDTVVHLGINQPSSTNSSENITHW